MHVFLFDIILIFLLNRKCYHSCDSLARGLRRTSKRKCSCSQRLWHNPKHKLLPYDTVAGTLHITAVTPHTPSLSSNVSLTLAYHGHCFFTAAHDTQLLPCTQGHCRSSTRTTKRSSLILACHRVSLKRTNIYRSYPCPRSAEAGRALCV